MYGEHLTPDVERPPLVERLVRAWQPQQGWLVFVLTWVAVMCLPAAAITGQLIIGLAPTAWLATLALVLAWWLAGRRISGWPATGVLALCGLAADLLWGVQVVRIGPLAVQWLRWLTWWFGERDLPAPVVTYFEDQWAALVSFGQRLGWWISGLLSGEGAPDNLVVIGLAGLAAWTLAAWAGWWIARRGQPFPALLPTGALLAWQVYWADDTRWTLLIFLGSVTLLLVIGRVIHAMAAWEQQGVDYSPEIILDTVGIGIAFTAVVVLLAPVLPFLTSRQASQAFWRLFESPYRKVEARVSNSFADVRSARSLVPPAGAAAGGMPRAHLLAAGPELSREIALRVRVRGAEPGETLYWRGQTFAVYTGRGWTEAEADERELRLAAGEPWNPAVSQVGRLLVNQVEVVAGSRAVLYAAGEPIAADRPYRAWLRAAGELIALSANDAPARYTVLSQLNDFDLARPPPAAEIEPSAAISLYLQLPADLDRRLSELAARWTAGATTPYERAVAIESALRQLPYSLEVPAPPAGQEVSSWFLFDLRRGYCDYFASAMVVLARLSGIPARLAVGYAAGSYDPRADRYTLTGMDAHSWPELFFPGYGWVRFEPTPAQPVPIRPESLAAAMSASGASVTDSARGPDDLAAGMAELQALAAGNATVARRRWIVQGVTGALNGLLLLSWLAGWWSGQRKMSVPPGVAPGVAAGFQRLTRWGARLGRPVKASDTPREYASAVICAAVSIADHARGRLKGTREAAQVVSAAALRLVEDYESTLYGPAEGRPAGGKPQQAWWQLWAACRRLWWARRMRRLFK